MLLVVADTSPLRYLVQIGEIEILPQLFEKILIPTPVYEELSTRPRQHRSVRGRRDCRAGWRCCPAAPSDDPALSALDPGEKAAIVLGLSLRADLILIDDRKGLAVAVKKGFQVTGTLGLLSRAAHRGLVDLTDAFRRLRQTNFRFRKELMDALLDQNKRR